MQNLGRMDFRDVEKIVDDTKKTFEDGGGGGDVAGGEKLKGGENRAPEAETTTNDEVDSSIALQLFLDRVPISSVPGINNSSSSVLELKSEDCLGDAIRVLYEKNVSGAPIADTPSGVDTVNHRRLSDRYIGFIDFSRMVLWSLEEYENMDSRRKDECRNHDFFSMLEKNPHISDTKIGELAKSFLWDSFFPVHLDDTLFHVLLLFSKHRLQVVPVTKKSSAEVIGFVTQNAVIQLLLQSDGLEWFNSIAEKPLSEFRFENDERPFAIYEDESIMNAIDVLWKNQIGAVAVVQRETQKLTGCVRTNDLYLLLDNNGDLFRKRRNLTVESFIRMDSRNEEPDPTIERDLGALLSAGNLTLRNSFIPRMDSPVTNKKTDTLKQAMKNLAASKCNFCFLIDDSEQVRGMLTLRDMIIQFAPPSVDSRINGGCFFESALEQTGCRIEGGTMVCDH